MKKQFGADFIEAKILTKANVRMVILKIDFSSPLLIKKKFPLTLF